MISKERLEELIEQGATIYSNEYCLKFQLGVCGGAQYHIPNICEQPLCDKVRNELKELKNEQGKRL